MKYFTIIASVLFCFSAQAIDLVIRPVDADSKKLADVRLPLPTKKEEVVLERESWKCKAQSITKEWGIFRCENSDGLEVSTRFNCNKAKSFEQHQGFRIAKKGAINLTLSIWCE